MQLQLNVPTVAAVTSVFGRIGAVIATLGDYSFSLISGICGLAQGGTGVDLSLSGGATQIVAQDAAHVISARNLVAADIPNLDAAKITTGALAVARGGTGTGSTLTGLVRGNASAMTAAELTGDVATSGSNVTAIATGAVTDTKASLLVKPSVGLVAVANLTLTGAQTIDGVLGTAGQTLVLATAQSTGSQNGPWVMQSGAWTRPTWYPTGGTTQAIQFSTFFVRLGTAYSGSVWRLTTSGAITIDTTATAFSQTPLALSATSVSQILPGANLGLTINAQTGTTYTVLDSDRGKLITFSNAAVIAVTLPQAGAASSFLANWYTRVKNIGASTVTLTPTTSTVETAAQVIIPPGASAMMVSDGTNFRLADVSVDTSLNGWDFFGMDGDHRVLIGAGGQSIVSAANAVLAMPLKLDKATLVKTIKFSNVSNTTGSTQTTDMGIADTQGNLILHSGVKSFLTAAAQSFTSQSVTATIFLPGTYLGCWTASVSANFTFISTPTYIIATSATWGNSLTPKGFIVCGGFQVAGALPASLGTLTGSALGSGGANAIVPVVLFASA